MSSKKLLSKKAPKYESDEEHNESEEFEKSETDNERSNIESSEEEEESEGPDGENTMDVRNCVIKIIDTKGFFGIGEYLDLKIYVMMENNAEKGYCKGYINSTKLCGLVNKEVKSWFKNDSAKNLIKSFEKALSEETDNELVLKNIRHGNPELRGSYVHPSLIPHIASWASTDFAFKVSTIIQQFAVSKIIEEKNSIINKKDKSIDQLNKKVNKLLCKQDELLGKNDELLEQNKTMDKTLRRILRENSSLSDKMDNMCDTLFIVSNTRVVATDRPGDNNMFIVMKNNPDPDDYEEGETFYPYSFARVLKSGYIEKMKNHSIKYPHMKIALKINYTPNSVNLGHRIKNNLKGKIICKGCNVTLKKGYTEKKFIEDITTIHDERLDVDTD